MEKVKKDRIKIENGRICINGIEPGDYPLDLGTTSGEKGYIVRVTKNEKALLIAR